MTLQELTLDQKKAALRFNFAPQVDPHFLKDALKPLDVDKISSSFLLSSAASKKLHHLPRFYDFTTDFRRLALLPRLELIRLILYAGAAGYHRSLKKIIKAYEVRKLRTSLGSVFNFALRVAPLLSPPNISGQLPKSASGFAAAGHKMLVMAAANESAEFQSLLALRFPPNLKWDSTAVEKSEELSAFFVRVAGQMKK